MWNGLVKVDAPNQPRTKIYTSIHISLRSKMTWREYYICIHIFTTVHIVHTHKHTQDMHKCLCALKMYNFDLPGGALLRGHSRCLYSVGTLLTHWSQPSWLIKVFFFKGKVRLQLFFDKYLCLFVFFFWVWKNVVHCSALRSTNYYMPG